MSEIDSKNILDIVEMLNGIKSLISIKDPLLPVYSALGGAFIGAVSGIIPITISNLIKDRKKKKSVTLAIYSEIKANLELYEHRKYLKTFQKIIDMFESDEIETYSLKIEISDNRFLVYKSQLDNLGILDSDVTVCVVRFYQLTEAIVQDVKPGGVLNTSASDINVYKELLVIAEKAIEAGYKTLSIIENKYSIREINA